MAKAEEDFITMIIRDFFFDGFETYDDYVKYGDMFTPLRLKPIEYTPAERQLTGKKL